MDAYEKKTGGSVLAIAHNGNLSNGTMFPIVEAFGKAIDRAYAEQRVKWERLYETTQMKGDGEAHPFLSPNDEFADYELWDKGNLDASVAKTKEMLEFEYTRSALKNGLMLEAKLGVNPYKFGLVGSSDAHTGLASFEEDNFFGKTTPQEPSAHRMTAAFMDNAKSGVKIMDWEVVSSGYAAVWAEENTRASIWDAMQRRETYATTGSRMVVRFFGGWDFEASDANNRMPAKVGYTQGRADGRRPECCAPGQVTDVSRRGAQGSDQRRTSIASRSSRAGSTRTASCRSAFTTWRFPTDGRSTRMAAARLRSGNTVDVPNATWTNTIGAGEFITVWKDPDFDPALRAFYYVRVIEIPTPRWTAYDAKYFGTTPLPGTRMTVTERAYTSPIWYTP